MSLPTFLLLCKHLYFTLFATIRIRYLEVEKSVNKSIISMYLFVFHLSLELGRKIRIPSPLFTN